MKSILRHFVCHSLKLAGWLSIAGGASLSSLAMPADAAVFYSNFNAENSSNFSLFNTTARPVIYDDRLRLTHAIQQSPDAPFVRQTGAAWYGEKQNVTAGFETTFQFQITNPGGTKDSTGRANGDGFAFVIGGNDYGVGGDGGGIGYAGLENTLAIEFDTWFNDYYYYEAWNGDPNGDHISVQSRGTAANSEFIDASLGYATAIPSLHSDQIRTAKIRYVPGSLEVFLDNLDLPVLRVAADLSSLLNLEQGKARIGFTSATQSAWSNHDILSWSYQDNQPTEKQVPEPSALVGLVAIAFLAAAKKAQRV